MDLVHTTVVTESKLQRALDCGELIRLYQPVIDLGTNAPVQVEALLRWDHPARGLLAPREFLVDEDDSALLVRIGCASRRGVAARVRGATDHGGREPVR
jgi:EAL domain-containing protein (putative c-di-GMP-specific phosphodiesterase class I)